MVSVDERPYGIVPKIVSGGLLDRVSQQDAGYGKELQKVQIRDAFLSLFIHDDKLKFLLR